jgi:hypothetical protein
MRRTPAVAADVHKILDTAFGKPLSEQPARVTACTTREALKLNAEVRLQFLQALPE